MSDDPIQIKRYPNRRYYARNTSTYVSLQEIEQMIQEGNNVEIRDSQTGEDLTRAVLTQMLLDRHPDKMALFPTAMLHFILRSNDVMSGFLRDYFRHSLTYLDYLQQHSRGASAFVQPMHWAKAWLDGLSSIAGGGKPTAPTDDSASLRARIDQLEQRLSELEAESEPPHP